MIEPPVVKGGRLKKRLSTNHGRASAATPVLDHAKNSTQQLWQMFGAIIKKAKKSPPFSIPADPTMGRVRGHFQICGASTLVWREKRAVVGTRRRGAISSFEGRQCQHDFFCRAERFLFCLPPLAVVVVPFVSASPAVDTSVQL
jgi:hypothetical protein